VVNWRDERLMSSDYWHRNSATQIKFPLVNDALVEREYHAPVKLRIRNRCNGIFQDVPEVTRPHD
jgi:hypothetical protein